MVKKDVWNLEKENRLRLGIKGLIKFGREVLRDGLILFGVIMLVVAFTYLIGGLA